MQQNTLRREDVSDTQGNDLEGKNEKERGQSAYAYSSAKIMNNLWLPRYFINRTSVSTTAKCVGEPWIYHILKYARSWFA
jgi:hypothetical protein